MYSVFKVYFNFRKIKKKKVRKNLKYLKYKKIARTLVYERLDYFNKFYGFKWNKISIRNQKTRWGSCSKAGNLNFNYKIALLSPEIADYIIVHELCHLREFNHSQNFWDLVEKTIPNYKAIQAKLKNNPFNLTKNKVK